MFREVYPFQNIDDLIAFDNSLSTSKYRNSCMRNIFLKNVLIKILTKALIPLVNPILALFKSGIFSFVLITLDVILA